MALNLVKDGEIEQFAHAVGDFLEGRLDGEKFTAIRLQHGIYGQRQEGVHMVRIKLPGGRFTGAQLAAIADTMEQFSEDDKVCVTTRQDIQLHFVPIAQVVGAMQRLAQDGLVTREACGNTVRNVTACPLAGVCPKEHVDINPHLEATVLHCLRHPLTQHMPRKFKISFSGCESDCAQGLLHDIGIVAARRGDEVGFKVLAAGGLGHKPREAIVVEEFLPERELLPCVEALITLHQRYSDRTKRARSRSKFLIDRFGAEGFLEKYREEYARSHEAFLNHPHVEGEWRVGQDGEPCGMGAPRQVMAQKQPGLVVFPIGVPLGDLTAPVMRGLVELMDRLGLTELRATQDQNLTLVNVPRDQVEAVRAGLKALNLSEPKAGDDVVACPGTWTCKLGITSSRTVAEALTGGDDDLSVRVSGCHNGCAQPYVGDIGLHGEGRRLFGKLIPHYYLHLGGSGLTGGALAIKGPAVPTARIGAAVERVRQTFAQDRLDGERFFTWARRRGAEYFIELLRDLSTVTEAQLPQVLKDHGQQEAFRVLQLGGGECAGAAQEVVAANLADATHERGYRNTFTHQRMYPEALECAEAVLLYVGKCLAHVAHAGEVDAIPELLTRLRGSDTLPAEVVSELQALAAEIQALTAEFDLARFQNFSARQDAWMDQARATAERLDQQLALGGPLGVSLNLNLPAA